MPKRSQTIRTDPKLQALLKLLHSALKRGEKKGRNGVKPAHLGLLDAFLEVLWNLGIPLTLGTNSHLMAEKPRVYKFI